MPLDRPYDKNASLDERIEWMLRVLFDETVTDWDLLTDWECRFVHDMERRRKAGYDLTEAQLEKLEQIYTERQ
jgi:hypothetical protein